MDVLQLPPQIQNTLDEQNPQYAGAQNGPVIPGTAMPAPPVQPLAAPPAPDIQPQHPVDRLADAFLSHLIARDRASMPQPPRPAGSFADKLAGAIRGVGADLGDAAHATDNLRPGEGWLSGIENTMAAKNARIATQNQQANENARADARLKMEQQRTAAEISQAQVNEIHLRRMIRNEDQEFQQKSLDSATAQAQPYEDMGAEQLGSHLSQQQLHDMMSKNQIDPTKGLFFIDGYVPALDKNGKQIIDDDGQPKYAPTWKLLSNVPQVTLSPDRAAYLNKYAPTNVPWKEGQTLSGSQYYSLTKRAAVAEGTDLKMQEAKAIIAEHLSAAERDQMEARDKKLTLAEKDQNREAERVFAPYLAQANGDTLAAYALMANDPKGKKNLGLVNAYFGPGAIEKYRANVLTNLNKTIADDSRTLNDPVKSSSMDPQDKADMQSELASAKARRNAVLGIHSQAPDEAALAIQHLDQVTDVNQRWQQIVTSKTLTPQMKARLLLHYNYSVPPEIQAQLPQTAPAAQNPAQ